MAFILLLLAFAYTRAVTVRLSYIIFIVIGLATRNAAGGFQLNTGDTPVNTGASPARTGVSLLRS